MSSPDVGAAARAVVVSVTQDLLNDLVLFAIGGGVPLEPLETALALPGMGEVDVRLALTVTGGTMNLLGRRRRTRTCGGHRRR